MERERRLEGVCFADTDTLIGLADRVLEDFILTVTRGPTVGLLALRVEEPFERLPFNFTEVTVSEAEVMANGHRGYAMVLGREPEKALAGAVLDVAMECGHRLSADIERALQAALDREDERLRTEWSRVVGTRVNFEEMAP